MIRFDESPTTSDIVLFELSTPDDKGNLIDPVSLDDVVISFLERMLGKNTNSLEEKKYNPQLVNEIEKLQEEIEEGDIAKAELLKFKKEMLELTSVKSNIYYKDEQVVMTTISPLWTPDDPKPRITHMLDKNGDPIPGKFGFRWQPEGMREGDYLITWHYQHENSKKRHTKRITFKLFPSDTRPRNIHTRYTPEGKYQLLMNRYLPKMYKNEIKKGDLTPDVVKRLNNSFAEHLTELENYANQLIDLIDPHYTHPTVLPLLANMFGMKLRGDNVDGWRAQIANAFNLSKKRGTLEGLQEALLDAGIKLNKLTLLWQVVSPSKWTDGFLIKEHRFSSDSVETLIGKLSKPFKEVLKVEFRPGGEKDYIELPIESVIFSNEEGKTNVYWNGETLEQPLELFQSDYLKITYRYADVVSEEIEKYIDDLSLGDQRDECEIEYPRKNWNVKLIEEDDPLFDVVIGERHPFHPPVVFGRVRTSFMYSENVYNMDAYNGSLKNSLNPCDIDKDFIDECSGGQSSKFNIYIEIDKLSDDRIREAQQIIREYSPFHAILHRISVSTKIRDFFFSPVERIQSDFKNKDEGIKEMMKATEKITCKIRYKDGRDEDVKVIL